jgi:hypothetical protein
MNAKLIERLRKLSAYGCCLEAADELEANEAELIRTRAVLACAREAHHLREEKLRDAAREAEALISRILTDEDYFARPRNRDCAERMHVRLSELINWPPRQG